MNEVKSKLDQQLEDAIGRVSRIAENARAIRNRLEAWAATQAQTIACKRHPNVIRAIDWNKSSIESVYATEAANEDTFKLRYTPCAECESDEAQTKAGNWLKTVGVPEILLHGTLGGFRCESPDDIENVRQARRFVKDGRGALIMTGNLGDGKSLLAVGVLREFHGGFFITHNNLLLDLRRGYNHPKAVDIIQKASHTKCLVVDDFGLSMGGNDELPMLQSIFDHRHGEKIPFVITSNLTLEAIYEAVGARLADRFRQALFKHLQFTGPSSRPAERQSYFAEQ